MNGNQSTDIAKKPPGVSCQTDRRKLWGLWIGLGVYFVIMLNAFRYAHRIPYQAFILGALLNVAVITSFILALRRVYKRIGR